MKDSHFCYLNGLHASQEPKLRLYGERAPWYRQISLTGWIATFAILGMFFGLSTGLYSCAKSSEVREVLSYEFPIGHPVEISNQKPTLSGSAKAEKRRP